MKIVATAFSLLLMWSVEAAHAAPITFEVEYTTLFHQRCFSNGVCVFQPNDPFTRTFTLDPSQLMVDGVYDVGASLDPSPIIPPPPGTVTISLNADATVADGQVIDMVMGFLETVDDPSACSGFGLRLSSSFTESFGTWSSDISRRSTLPDFCNPGSETSNGTYTVQQLPVEVPVEVPEPGSLLLVLGGGLFARLRTRPRVH